MKDKIMTILIAVVIIEVLLLTLGSVFAMLGMMGFNTGCVYRYDLENGSTTASDTFSRNMSIRADANYSANVGTVDGVKTIVRDSGSYGKWKRANLTLAANQIVNIEVDGIVSLCTSYLPVNNIGSDQNVRSNGAPISIPRVEDSLTPPVTLIFDARMKDWRNIL